MSASLPGRHLQTDLLSCKACRSTRSWTSDDSTVDTKSSQRPVPLVNFPKTSDLQDALTRFGFGNYCAFTLPEVRRKKQMKTNKLYFLIGLIIASALFFEVAAHADEWDLTTKLTFSEPVQIPGQVLPAGTYLFKLANNASDRHIVQVFNSDGTALYATLMAISTQRRDPSGKSVVTFAEQGAGRPEALVKWFYPGETTGNEFVYSKQEEKQLAQDKQQTIFVKDAAESGD
jgi:hypothetical protein